MPAFVCWAAPDFGIAWEDALARRQPHPTDESGNAGGQVLVQQGLEYYKKPVIIGNAARDAQGNAAALAISRLSNAATCLSRR